MLRKFNQSSSTHPGEKKKGCSCRDEYYKWYIRSWEPANVPLFSYIIFNPIDFRLPCPSGVYIRFFSPTVYTHTYIYIVLTLLARLRVCVNVYTAGIPLCMVYITHTQPTHISHYPTDSIYRLLQQTTARSASRRCSLKKHPFFHRCYNITIIIMFPARILYACERVVHNIYIHIPTRHIRVYAFNVCIYIYIL